MEEDVAAEDAEEEEPEEEEEEEEEEDDDDRPVACECGVAMDSLSLSSSMMENGGSKSGGLPLKF